MRSTGVQHVEVNFLDLHNCAQYLFHIAYTHKRNKQVNN